MWMVEPSLMCRKHLLGEHVETHMLAGSLLRGRSVQGFLERGLLEPQNVHTRHAVLAAEMARRGYKHASQLPAAVPLPKGCVDRAASLKELHRRCAECAARFPSSAGCSRAARFPSSAGCSR